jgi:hypothetical protein
MKLSLIFLVAQLAGSWPAAAQAPEPPAGWAPRRWTVGVQAAFYPRFALAEARDGQSGTEYVRPWPVMPTIAYQVRQRGSVEVGLLLRTMPTRTTTVANSSGTSVTQRRAISWAVPIMARSHLLGPNTERWQADFEIGLLPLSASYREESTYTDAKTGQQSNFYSSNSYGDVLLVGGLGGAYALTPHLRLTADARVAFSVLLALVSSYLSNNGVKNEISPFAPALSAGVGYQFGKTL